MIIECKNCNTKFRVKTSDIGENGRMVNCSVCRYEWLYIPEETPVKDNLAREFVLSEEMKLQEPAITQGNSIFFTLIINLLIISIFGAVFLYVERDYLIRQHYTIEAFYKRFDYHNIDGLKLKVMRPEKLQYLGENGDEKVWYTIPIKIINYIGKTRFLQAVRIAGYDVNHHKIMDSFVDIRKNIAAYSELDINLQTEEIRQEINFVVVRMGNFHDLKNFNPSLKFR